MREHVVRLLDSMRAHANDADMCMREFSKPSMYRAYIWYFNLIPGPTHDLKHLFLIFNTNFFCAEAKFTIIELEKCAKIQRRTWMHM